MKKNILKYIKITLALVLFLQVGQASAQTISFTGGSAYTTNGEGYTYSCGDISAIIANSGVANVTLLNDPAVTITSSTAVTSMSFLMSSIGDSNIEGHKIDALGITNEVVSIPSCAYLTVSNNTVSNFVNSSGVATRITVTSVTPFTQVTITRTVGTYYGLLLKSSVQVIPCNAGATAPTLSATTINNSSCATPYVNLNSLVTSTLPTGASLVWYTNNAHTGNPVLDPTKVATNGTYYAFYYDAENNCYSPASAAVTATYTVCPLAIATTCPTVSVDLASRVQDAAPAGYTYTYHTGTPATTGNKLTSSVVTTSGTYYVGTYATAQSCYTATSRPIGVTITNCCVNIAPAGVN